tara:strand:- start:337 stop:756 length:420 start_codon:yes stop_codon:yes gene_type:complete
MEIHNKKFYHLINNLERTSLDDSIFNYEFGRRALLSLGKGNIRKWIDSLLPNTRLIIEPMINGSSIGIQYLNGRINKIISKDSKDLTKEISSLKSIPQTIPIKKRIAIRGVLFEEKIRSIENNNTNYMEKKKLQPILMN